MVIRHIHPPPIASADEASKSLANALAPQVNKKIGFQSYQAAVNVEVLAILAIVFSPLTHVTAMFNINDFSLRPSVTNFLFLFATLAAAHTVMYLLVLRCRGVITPS